MAFRIHESVVRGEIDNRVKGMVRGKIWVEGRAEPVALELKGNAWPDLAGCLLTFTNSQKRVPHPHLKALHPMQRGTIGDLTASRKVRVWDVPLDQAWEMLDRKQKPRSTWPTVFISNGSAKPTGVSSSRARTMRSRFPRRNGA